MEDNFFLKNLLLCKNSKIEIRGSNIYTQENKLILNVEESV